MRKIIDTQGSVMYNNGIVKVSLFSETASQTGIEKGQIRGYFKQMVRKERKQDTWKQRKNYLLMQD